MNGNFIFVCPFAFSLSIYFMLIYLVGLGTIAKGAELLHQEGAREVYACSTHAVFRYSHILFY